MGTTNKLAILVSKQCDAVINGGVVDRFIHGCYDVVEETVEQRAWQAVRSNSITVTAAFGLRTYPEADLYGTEELIDRFVTPCTHVLAFWGGGPRFVETLREAIAQGKKVRIYRCDPKTNVIKLIANSAIAESSW